MTIGPTDSPPSVPERVASTAPAAPSERRSLVSAGHSQANSASHLKSDHCENFPKVLTPEQREALEADVMAIDQRINEIALNFSNPPRPVSPKVLCQFVRDIGKELDRYDDRIRKLHGSANFAQVYRGFRRDDLYARLADLTETARIRDKNIPSITHAIDRLIKPASPLVAHYRATPVVPPHPSKHGGKGLIDL